MVGAGSVGKDRFEIGRTGSDLPSRAAAAKPRPWADRNLLPTRVRRSRWKDALLRAGESDSEDNGSGFPGSRRTVHAGNAPSRYAAWSWRRAADPANAPGQTGLDQRFRSAYQR